MQGQEGGKSIITPYASYNCLDIGKIHNILYDMGGCFMEQAKMLARLRAEKGLSQKEVAKEVGVTRQAVSGWESGRTQPSVEKLVAVCRLYGVPVEELYPDDTVQEKEAVPEEMPSEAGDTLEAAEPKAELSRKRKWMILAAVMVWIWCGTFLWGRLTNSRAAAANYVFWETAILIVGLTIKLVWRHRKK